MSFTVNITSKRSRLVAKIILHYLLRVMKETSGMLSNSLYPPRTAQGHYVHAYTSFWKVRVEKPATRSVTMLGISQHRCCSYVKLVEHNEMCRQDCSRCITAELVCS